jgi:hypothetical protein
MELRFTVEDWCPPSQSTRCRDHSEPTCYARSQKGNLGSCYGDDRAKVTTKGVIVEEFSLIFPKACNIVDPREC